jgi:ribosomal protein S12 methylthiotransferase
MRRRQPSLDVERLAERLRERIPDLALRTSMMVGFPGEDRAAFARLLEGVRTIRFDRLGAFVFSPEPGTPAAAMAPRPTRRTARRRFDRLMRLQAEIAAALSCEQIGRTVRVLVEAVDPEGDAYIGRTARDAPEVDGVVRFTSARPLRVGSFVDVEVTAAETYDLVGKTISEEL